MQNGILIVIASLLTELVLLVLTGIVVLIVRRRRPVKRASDEGLVQEYTTLAQRLAEVHDILLKAHEELSISGQPGADSELGRCIGLLRRSAALLGSGQASAAQVGLYLLDAQETLLLALLEQARAARSAPPAFDFPRMEPGPVAPAALMNLGLKAELEALHQLVSGGLEAEAMMPLSPMMQAWIKEPAEPLAVMEDWPIPPVEEKMAPPALEAEEVDAQPERPLTEAEIEALMQADLDESLMVKEPPPPEPEPPESAADNMGSLLQDEIDALLSMAQESPPPAKSTVISTVAPEPAPAPPPRQEPAPLEQAIEIMDAWQPEVEPEPTYMAIDEKGSLLQDEIDALLSMAQEIPPVKNDGQAEAYSRETLPPPEAALPVEPVQLSEMVMQDEIDALMKARDEQRAAPAPARAEPLLQDEIDSLMMAPRLPVSIPPEPLPADRGALMQDEIDALLNTMGGEALGPENGNGSKKSKAPAAGAIPQAHHNEIDLQSEIDALFAAAGN